MTDNLKSSTATEGCASLSGSTIVPPHVAVCPECSGPLECYVDGWDEDYKYDVSVYCENDPIGDHRGFQCDWQPIIDAVEEWMNETQNPNMSNMEGSDRR